MKIAIVMKLIQQNIKGMKILLPEATGRRHVLKQSSLFDGQPVLVMKSIKFHCHKMTKCLLHSFKEMELESENN